MQIKQKSVNKIFRFHL